MLILFIFFWKHFLFMIINPFDYFSLNYCQYFIGRDKLSFRVNKLVHIKSAFSLLCPSFQTGRACVQSLACVVRQSANLNPSILIWRLFLTLYFKVSSEYFSFNYTFNLISFELTLNLVINIWCAFPLNVSYRYILVLFLV